MQTQNVDIDQHPSSGSISVFLTTKYNIDSALSLYHITIYLHVTIYITLSIYRGSTTSVTNTVCGKMFEREIFAFRVEKWLFATKHFAVACLLTYIAKQKGHNSWEKIHN